MENMETKKILVISGTHGNESNAVQTVYDLKNYFETCMYMKPGELVFYQAYNKTGLAYNTREFVPNSDKEINDMNRVLPFKEPIFKDDLITTLQRKLEDADVVIDVHNSPICKNLIIIDNNRYAPHFIKFAEENSIRYCLKESCGDTIKSYVVNKLEKPGFTVEIGDMGWESKDKDNSGVVFLTHLITSINQWISQEKYNFSPCKDLYTSEECLRLISTHADGLIRESGTDKKLTKEQILRTYKRHEPICEIVDPDTSELLETIKAPCDGTLVCIDDTSWACIGGTLGEFQPDLNSIGE